MGPETASWITGISRRLGIVIVCVQLTGCHHTTNYAPVTDLASTKVSYKQHTNNKISVKSVKPIKAVYPASSQQVVFQRVNFLPAPEKRDPPAKIKLLPEVPSWVSPANGRIVALYSPRHRGIDISGQLGDPVYAISSGNIVYAGNGLRGYGNLIIIKHDNEYLSAYAYNKTIKVKAGDWVKKGQIIGEMGYREKNKVMLYFELRRNGQPIDPLSIRGIMNG